VVLHAACGAADLEDVGPASVVFVLFEHVHAWVCEGGVGAGVVDAEGYRRNAAWSCGMELGKVWGV
jgi:hypothetical protein